MNTPASNEDRDQLPFARHHAFIIGIDDYENVSPLQTAVADAQQLADVLSRQQHFLVHPVLLNSTGAEIRELLQHTLSSQVESDDRVFFYFAGHGIASDGDEGPAGYIVPADGVPDDVTTFVPMDDLQAALDSLPCRHLLLVLDCCFSGAFKWSSRYRDIGGAMPKKIYKERFDRFIEDPAWQVITSAAYDQKALDVLDGRPTGERGNVTSADRAQHSPFAQALFDGLSGDADARTDANGEGDGVITATELYAYIRDQVEPETIKTREGLRQTPGFFPLKKHDKGEFIFLKPNHRLNLPPIPNKSPYKGLVSFDEADRDLFYGRDSAIKDLQAVAADNKLIVVTGASGTGKSSVIKAGLLPLLRAAGFPILDVMRPGAHPLAELEKALKEADAALATTSQNADVSGAVLLIDQLEEVITRCEDPDERREFDVRLRQLLDDERIHRLILTVRSDFEPQFNKGALQSEWSKGQYTVLPFSLEELKEVIVLPTMQEVLIFDPPELVDTIIAEVVQSPGALPLLSYTLGELYEAYRTSGRQDRALTQEDYDELGGVMGALHTRADSLYKSLSPPEQDTMRKIMLRMVSVEGDLAGKRVPMDDLVYSDEEMSVVDKVVERLVEARLVVKGKDYIEPAHDALVRAWTTLHDWTFEVGKDKLILGGKLNVVANEFAQSGKRGLLWNNNPNLPVLVKEINRPKQWFNTKEITFVEASNHRKIANKRRTIGITAAVMVALITAAGYSARQNSLARAELQRSTALRISAVADDIITSDERDLPGGSERALQQIVAASLLVDPLPDPPAEVAGSMLMAEMALDSGVKHVDLGFTTRALSVSSGSQNLALGGIDAGHGVVRLWDTRQQSVTTLLEESGQSIYSVAYSPDGMRIAAAGLGGILWLWTNERDSPKRIDLPVGFIWSVAFSPDGERIAVGGNDERVTLYDVSDLQSFDDASGIPINSQSVIDAYGIVQTVAFSGDGNLIAAGTNWGKRVRMKDEDSDGWREVRVQVQDGLLGGVTDDMSDELPDDYKGPPTYVGIAANYDGSLIATAGKDARGDEHGKVRLWNRATGYGIGQLLEGLVDAQSVAFSPDGSRVVAGNSSGKVVVWDAETGELLVESVYGRQRTVMAVAFSSDGRQVVSLREDGTLNLWEPDGGPPASGVGSCEPSASSSDEMRIAEGGPGDLTFGQGGTLRLFNSDEEPVSGAKWAKGHQKGRGNDNKNRPPPDRVTCVAFSDDGTKIVSSSTNDTIQFWDAGSDSLVAAGDSIPGNRFVFSRYGGLIAVAQSDEDVTSVNVYDATSRIPIGGQLTGREDWSAIYQRARSSSGPEAGRQQLCSRLTRNMSRSNWQEWVSTEIDYVVQCPGLPVPD